MTRHTLPPPLVAARQELSAIQQKGRLSLAASLRSLDPTEPSTLTFAVQALLHLHFEQKELSELLTVSRTTIGRWAQNENIPRSPGYRKWAVETLSEHLQKAL